MTDKELKNLVASLAISQAKTDEQINRTSREIQELKISQSQTDEQMKQTDKIVKDMTITLKNLGLNVSGINKTTGQEAEEFFYSSLNNNKQLNSIKFDSISSNILVDKDDRTQEIDIFLENGNSVGIVEVKHKVKDKDIKQLQKIVDNFSFFHPTFKNYKIIPALAGKVFPKHIQDKALKNGFVVLTQVGNHIEQRVPKDI